MIQCDTSSNKTLHVVFIILLLCLIISLWKQPHMVPHPCGLRSVEQTHTHTHTPHCAIGRPCLEPPRAVRAADGKQMG